MTEAAQVRLAGDRPKSESGPCKLLLVEDSPSDARLLEAQLRDDVLLQLAVVERVGCLADARVLLQEVSFDAVLLDLGLPDSDGLETLAEILPEVGSAALVVITGQDDSALAEEAVRQGAQDYLVKGGTRTGDMGRAVAYAIRRQRVLEQLARARDEQLATKNRFLSHISHELRSPLTVVHQFASLLSDGACGEPTASQRALLTVLMRNVNQLRVMINDLLDVSRTEVARLVVQCRVVNLEELLKETAAGYQPAARNKGLRLRLSTPPLPAVVADPDRVREVLANLLDNAIKFSDTGSVTLSATVDPDHVCVTVRDTGCGIAPADLDHVFEQFFQANQSDDTGRNGLGLGLFVSRELIERQHGTMSVQSQLEQGTAVSFTLPLAPNAPHRGAEDAHSDDCGEEHWQPK